MLEENENKMAAALYLLSPGNSFTYYGEEIGIEADSTSSDAYYRTAMIWDNEDLPKIYANGIRRVSENPLGGVNQQLARPDSLLNTYRTLVKIRLQNPEIARGDIVETFNTDDINCAGYIVDYDGSRVLVLHNASKEAKEITIDAISNPELRGWSVAEVIEGQEQGVSLDGSTLKVSAKTSVVLKEN